VPGLFSLDRKGQLVVGDARQHEKQLEKVRGFVCGTNCRHTAFTALLHMGRRLCCCRGAGGGGVRGGANLAWAGLHPTPPPPPTHTHTHTKKAEQDALTYPAERCSAALQSTFLTCLALLQKASIHSNTGVQSARYRPKCNTAYAMYHFTTADCHGMRVNLPLFAANQTQLSSVFCACSLLL